MKLEYQLQRNWPPLAWIAKLCPHESRIEVNHGRAVEIRSDWFCECVWDGPFRKGGFDQTDIVAGTGGRIRKGNLYLVSSGSTVDRLQFIEHKGSYWISNSLVCLMAFLGGSFFPAYPYYLSDFNSIIRGLKDYVKKIPSNLGPVSLVYFNNVLWDGRSLKEITKPSIPRDFNTFDSYQDFLKASLETFSLNMRAEERKQQYEFLGTLSTGYDSTTVTALAKPFGLREVLCFSYPNGRDRGVEIASALGVESVDILVNQWRKEIKPELPFLSVNGFGEEVHYASAESKLRGRVLLTGFHGDKVWDRNTGYPNPDIKRGDISGLALSEYRLWTNFIHCPIPFWGVRQIRSINQISRDPSMKPWDTGGDYTRPVCRRIVENAGVPRDAFGITKSQASRWFVLEPDNLTRESELDFFNYLDKHRRDWWGQFRIPPSRNRGLDNAKVSALRLVSSVLIGMPGWYRLRLNHWPLFGNLTALRIPNPPFSPMVVGTRRYYFPWAVERCKKRYELD